LIRKDSSFLEQLPARFDAKQLAGEPTFGIDVKFQGLGLALLQMLCINAKGFNLNCVKYAGLIAGLHLGSSNKKISYHFRET